MTVELSKALTRSLVIKLADEAIERMGRDHISPLYHMNCEGGPGVRVDQYREFSSSMCRYVSPQGEAGCIVGQVLHAYGVPLETLARLEGKGSSHAIRELRKAGWSVDADASILLSDLQDDQDAGIPWGALRDNVSSIA